ncbi:MAG: C40 family peptidase [Allomuricauda sp.]
MLRKTIILLLLFTFAACGPGKKRRTYSKTRTVTVEGSTTDTSPKRKPKKEGRKNAKANEIISTALTFSGTRYKYGGTTKKGMDCSGLVYVSLKENDIMFPRTSYQMALEGEKIRVTHIEKGDLLFFKTSKTGRRINHVGLVVDVDGNDIKFIHATTSRGVLVSSLREGYWNSAFVKAMRIL